MKPSEHLQYTDQGEPREIPPKKNGGDPNSFWWILLLLAIIYLFLAVMFNWWPISLLGWPL